MATNFRVLASLRQLAAAIFTKDVALRRDRGELHVVLAERPPPGQPRAPSREEAAKRKRQTELTQIRLYAGAIRIIVMTPSHFVKADRPATSSSY